MSQWLEYYHFLLGIKLYASFVEENKIINYHCITCIRYAENSLIEWNAVFLWIFFSQPDKYIIADDK